MENVEVQINPEQINQLIFKTADSQFKLNYLIKSEKEKREDGCENQRIILLDHEGYPLSYQMVADDSIGMGSDQGEQVL